VISAEKRKFRLAMDTKAFLVEETLRVYCECNMHMFLKAMSRMAVTRNACSRIDLYKIDRLILVFKDDEYLS